MQYRTLGKMGDNLSTVSFRAWAIGSTRREVNDKATLAALQRALDLERSFSNLEPDTLDLLQLHRPPTEVYRHDEVFGSLDDFRWESLLRQYGVSVETIGEALTAIHHPSVATAQIIFNAFWLQPAEAFFPAAQAATVGIIARVPLASGLLAGRLRRELTFAPADRCAFNDHREAFDRGETFLEVDYVELKAAQQLQEVVPA